MDKICKLKLGNYNLFFINRLQKDLAVAVINFVCCQKISNSAQFTVCQRKQKADLVIVHWENCSYYIKHYKNRNFKSIIRNILRPVSRYMKMSCSLLQAGIPVAEPVMAVSFKRNLFVSEGIFVMKEVQGKTLEEYLNSKQENEELKEVIKQLGIIWGKLYKYRYFHADPNTGNYIIQNSGNCVQLSLVDIDSLYNLPTLPKIMFFNRLCRFLFSVYCELAKNGRTIGFRKVFLFFQNLSINTGNEIKCKKMMMIQRRLLNRKLEKKYMRKISFTESSSNHVYRQF
jgi:hypothetical protein